MSYVQRDKYTRRGLENSDRACEFSYSNNNENTIASSASAYLPILLGNDEIRVWRRRQAHVVRKRNG